MSFLHRAARGIVPLLLVLPGFTAWSQTLSTNETWAYQLLEGSYLINDCLFCDRATFLEPMRGSFSLIRAADGEPGHYELRQIAFTAGRDTNLTYQVLGTGTYQQIATQQQALLQVTINGKARVMTNGNLAIERLWPILEIDTDQTENTFAEFYRLHLRAAPLREIWFSIATNLTIADARGTNEITSGDLLSTAGRIVKSNYGLLSRLGVMPFVKGNYGLDAADAGPGGDIVFSLEQDVFSETLGRVLREGDLLSSQGRVLATNLEIVSAFAPSASQTNSGLDAVKIQDDGEILFSVRTNFFSDRLGQTISRGDLLSNRGRVVRTMGDLLARFHPASPNPDAGLDAFYFWGSGEIWFSVEAGFTDNGLGPIGPGDLLSDQGYIVYRNKDLLAGFGSPPRDVDFGLDSLSIITDAQAGAPVRGATLSIGLDPQSESLRLRWEGPGRFFQLQSAAEVPGPYQALGPLDVDLFFSDSEVLKLRTNRFYRVRQW